MNHLSDDAKALFEAARPGHEPTLRDRDQVRTGLLIRIGGAAATLGVAQTGAAASFGPGAAIASGAKALLALKLIVGLTIAGGAGTVAYRSLAPEAPTSNTSVRARGPTDGAMGGAGALRPALKQHGQDAKQEASDVGLAPSPPEEPTALEAVPAHERPPARLEPTRSPTTTVPQPERRSPAGGAKPGAGTFPDETPRSSDLSREARALSGVQRAVRDGRSSEALALLDQQDRDFPQGELRQERVAARVVALCAAGRASQARALAASFLARAPRSPLAARMRTVCVGQ
jgi:hypothetical protein